MNRLMVVAAHPDDEILGCGGILHKTVKAGGQARIVMLTSGVTSRHRARDPEADAQVAMLREQALAAARTCGLADEHVRMLGFDDQALDTIRIHDLVLAIRAEIVAFEPDCLLGHHGGDYNVDHQACAKACLFATRPSPGEVFPARFGTFEVLSSTERAFGTREPFVPNLYVDVAEDLPVKLAAMAEYRHELREPPHPRSLDGVRAKARLRGLEVGLDYAEAFHIVRDIVSRWM